MLDLQIRVCVCVRYTCVVYCKVSLVLVCMLFDQNIRVHVYVYVMVYTQGLQNENILPTRLCQNYVTLGVCTQLDTVP